MVANWMAVTPDGRTLLVAESAGMRITAFSVDEDGSLHDRRTWAEVPPPDGICIDAEGAIAAVTTGAFLRVEAGGEVLEAVEVEGGRQAIARILGGSDRHTLYMLSATTRGEAAASLQAMAGQIEQVRVAVRGVGWP